MPHTIRFDKLRLSFLYILIPVSIALTISVGSLVFLVMDQLHIKIEPAVTFLNPVVALGYLLLSLSIIFLYLKPHTRWKIISGRIIAGIVFLFSVFTLIEFFGNVETHVVSTLYSKLRTGASDFKELMSIETGFLFLVLGLAYSCTSYKRILNKFSVTLNAVIFFISLVAIMGYVFGVPAFYKLHRLPDFNFFSALCAFALSIAGFFTRPVGSYFMILMSKGAAGAFARRVSVACLILPPLFGKLGLYYSTEGIPNSQAYALVAILCLLAMVGVVWKSSKELELIDRNRLGTEKERVKSIAQTDAILAKAPIGIALFGVTGDLIKANQIFYQYIIKNSDQINITKIDILKQHLHYVQNFNVAHLINSELPGKSFEIEVVENNKSIFLNLNFFVVKSAIGEFLGLGCSFVEITHLKEIESELRKARDEANSSNKAKSQFLANMSHEIRTPVGVIMGFLDIIKTKQSSNEEQNNHISIIERNCRQLLNIIDDILDLSKVEAGKIKIQKEEVNPQVLIEDLRAILELRTVEKNIELEVIVRDQLPSAIISDNNRMRQVILNICGNAIKFTKKGKVTLECFADSSKIYFRVTDQGCGIPTDQVEKLFKPFAQVDSSETREFGGNGLGLALSQKLANSLGGDVIIEKTTENIGSIFLVSFDMGLEELNEIGKKRQQSYPLKSKELDHEVPLKSKKVLVVDDSPDNRLLISYLLKNEEIEVETACDGSEGYDRALSQDYDLILLDLQMPVMGGYETAQKLRESGYKSPIVALTAHAMIGEKENCLNAGFNDYLTKPINKVKLLDVLKYNIENASL